MPDPLLDPGLSDPTAGLEMAGPNLPYVPSNIPERLGSELFQTTAGALDWLQKGIALYGGETFDPTAATTGLPSSDPRDWGTAVTPEPRISVDQAKEQFPGVTGIDEPLPVTVLQAMQREQRANATRQLVAERWPAGLPSAAVGLGTDLVASMLDPVNDAAFMVPVLGESRYAEWLAAAGRNAGWVGRLGVTAGVGAARGAAGAAILGGVELGTDPDTTLSDVAQQTLWTAAQGALFHTALNFRGDVLGARFRASPEGDAAAKDADLHDMATRVAAAQMADGEPIEVRPVFDAARVPSERPLASPYLDDAVARAGGEPSAEQTRWADEATEARATPPDKVFAGQMSEAQGIIAELRERGLLRPEDEAELAEAGVGRPEEEQAREAAGQPEREPEEPPHVVPAPVAAAMLREEEPRVGVGAERVGRGVLGEGVDRAGEHAAVIQDIDALIHRLAPGAEPRAYGSLTEEATGQTVSGATFGEKLDDGWRHIIAYSLASPDVQHAAAHEVTHALDRMNLYTPEERAALNRGVEQGGWTEKFGITQRYGDLSPEAQAKEAIGEAYADWRETNAVPGLRGRPATLIGGLFQRLRDAFDGIASILKQHFGGELTAEDVFRRIESGEIGAREPADQLAAEDAAFQREAFNEEDFDAAAAAKKQLTAMQDIAKRVALGEKVDRIHAAGLPIARGFDAEIRGINHAVSGARDSTAALQLDRRNEFTGRLTANLDKIPGALEAWRRRTLTAEWNDELAELNKSDGKPGISKSPLALEIAKAVHDAQDLARLRLNQSGAWIGDYDGYVARTQHDAIKIHKATYPVWRNDVLAGLDRDKTMEGLTPEAQEGFLHNMWLALSTGVHMSADHGVSPKAGVFPGGANIGKRVSSERVLHWRDADAWRTYQQKYGEPNIEVGVANNLLRAGRDAALLERWGSNPGAAFDELVRRTLERYRVDPPALADFQRNLPRIREEFAHLTGEASRPGNVLADQIRGSILGLQDISKLGNVLLAHMSTAVTKPYQLAYHGVGLWQRYTSVLRNLMQDTSPEGKQVMENLLANATGQMSDLSHGYEAVDGVPGQIAALRQFSMRLGGLPQMLARQKQGSQWELANFLGQQVDKTFDQLHPSTQRALTIYGIGPAEWDVLRTAPDHDRDGAGLLYLTPKAAYRANVDGLVGPRLERALDEDDANRMRAETADRLAMKLASYLSDSADRSTITPGIPERAFFTRWAGRYGGPIVGQYKTWAMAAVRQMWGQAILGSTKAEAVKSLAELVAVGTAIGYARMALTSAIQGQTPQLFNGDPKHDAILMTQSMVAGGGLGIWGDYLMGQYSRPGERGTDFAKDFALNVMGPAFGDAATIYGIGHEAAVGAFSDDPMDQMQKTGADFERFLTSHLPVVNVWYLHLLSHWLFIDRLNEMADPGYNERRQQAIQERTGQQTWLQPSYAGAQQ